MSGDAAMNHRGWRALHAGLTLVVGARLAIGAFVHLHLPSGIDRGD